MKKHIYLIIGVIAMVLTACQTIEEDSFDFGLTAIMEATSQTKTSMAPAEAGGYNVLWSESDKIAVYPDNDTRPSAFRLTGGAGTTKATFVGEVYGDNYTAFYPQSMLLSREGKILNINLPEEQTYNPGTFATDAYPMAAFSKSNVLQFKNLCSVMRVSLKGTAMVTKLVFKTRDPLKKVSGAASVDLSNPDAPVLTMDADASNTVTLNVVGGVQLSETEVSDFYLILPPQVYTDGFTVQIYTGDSYYSKTYNNEFTMLRSKMHKASPVTYNGPSHANKWLTFTSESTSAILLENVSDNEPVLYYSYDTENWEQWDYSALSFTIDDPLYLCGDNPDGFSHSSDKFSYFAVPSGAVQYGDFFVEGDIMSLINKEDDILEIPSEYCFANLFNGCDYLLEAPDLPATGLKKYCYYNMFGGCSYMEEAPQLPATTMAEGCYSSMFTGCESLSDAPVLLATTLADFCYSGMFYGCSSLDGVQETLPAMIMKDGCYADMFASCSSLELPPALPATTLAPKCYSGMFAGCPLLSYTPALSATTLDEYCYNMMFQDCMSIESAPDLPATTLVEGCYMNMFSGCTSLAQIKCLATDVSATDCTTGWMNNVPMGGTFTKDKDMHGWKGGQDGMPYEWFVENSDGSVFAVHYMAFIALPTQSASDYLLTLDNYGGNAPIVYYSNDAQNWKLWGYGGIPVPADDALFICGDNPDGFSKECSSNTWSNNGVFSSFNKTGEGDDILFNVYGDVMSLISKDVEVDAIPCDYCFCRLFKETPGLTIAPGISATTLTKKCYMQMFFGDTTLVAPPEGLPAMAMKDSCYFQMFAGCNKITYAPELPATTLADACYFGMFDSCSELVDAPDLPAPTLVAECYYQMFRNCNNLHYLTCLATDISAPDCTSDWLDGAPSDGVFTKASDMSSWTSGASGIPAGWTVLNAD